MFRKKLFVWITLLCLLLSGCGKETEENLSDPVQEEASIDYADRYQKLPVNDLFLGEWKRGELTEPEHFMAFTDYLPNVFPKNQEGDHYNRGFCADGESIYSLDTYYARGEDDKLNCTHYLNILDGLTREVKSITYRDPSFLSQPFLIGGRFFAVGQSMDENGNMQEFYVTELLPGGTLERKKNLFEVVEAEGMLPQQNFVSEVQLYYEPATDCFYLISPEEDRLIVLDAEGGLLEKQDGEDNKARFFLFAATPQGRILFLKLDGDTSTIFYFNQGEPSILFEGERGPEAEATKLTVDNHGRILFPENGINILEWDTESGTLAKLYVDASAADLSFGRFRGVDCVMRNENGELLILKDNALRIITEKGPAKQVTIVVKPLMFGEQTNLYRQYERTHPGVSFEILPKAEWAKRDVELAEVMQEMTEGAGPDLLVMSRQQMRDFEKNGCLTDLTDLLSAETKDKLIPGVLEYGRTENGIWLLSNQPVFQTMFVNQKYLKNSSWTTSEIIAIIEEREKAGEPFDQLLTFLYHPFLLFLESVFDSEFIDLEKGECSFDSELFIKVLEICKRYQDSEASGDTNKQYQLLKEGKLLMMMLPTMNLKNYSQARAALGDEYVPVGFPTVSGNGNRLNFDKGYAVNRNTKNSEVIADFLNWVFSRENESVEVLNSVPVRTDLFEGRLEYPGEFSWTQDPVIRVDSSIVIQIEGKPDGTAYVDEYMDLIQSGSYDKNRGEMNEISSIIWEEACAFFDGNKTASDTAKVIQSRVSLYLMENQ